MKKIVIDIRPDGSSKIDAIGFNGVGCAKATEMLELALAGNDPSNRDDRKKPDYYNQLGGTNSLNN